VGWRTGKESICRRYSRDQINALLDLEIVRSLAWTVISRYDIKILTKTPAAAALLGRYLGVGCQNQVSIWLLHLAYSPKLQKIPFQIS
jgi:hypothetical protein